MIDQNSQFMAILTNVGAAKLANSSALGLPWKLVALGVGDANGTDPVPSAVQTRLINERRRAPLNQLIIDPVNPAVIVAEQIIPADVGGWWIREVGLYDEDGDLVAVSNCAPSFKPLLDQGSGRTQIVRMNFVVSSTGNIVLKIDPAVVLATRQYVDDSVKSFATKAELNDLDLKKANNLDVVNDLKGKANKNEVYEKDDTYSRPEVDGLLDKKANGVAVGLALADKANKIDVYPKTETFSQDQIKALLKMINDQLIAGTTDKQGLMRFATVDEARAMTSALGALTPFTLEQAFRGQNQAPEVQRLPGKWIIQRGSAAIGSEGTGGLLPVTLPVAYPNGYSIIVSYGYTGSRVENANYAQWRNKTAQGFLIDNQWTSGGNDIGGIVDWITIGQGN